MTEGEGIETQRYYLRKRVAKLLADQTPVQFVLAFIVDVRKLELKVLSSQTRRWRTIRNEVEWDRWIIDELRRKAQVSEAPETLNMAIRRHRKIIETLRESSKINSMLEEQMNTSLKNFLNGGERTNQSLNGHSERASP